MRKNRLHERGMQQEQTIDVRMPQLMGTIAEVSQQGVDVPIPQVVEPRGCDCGSANQRILELFVRERLRGRILHGDPCRGSVEVLLESLRHQPRTVVLPSQSVGQLVCARVFETLDPSTQQEASTNSHFGSCVNRPSEVLLTPVDDVRLH